VVDHHLRTLLDCREAPEVRADSGRPGSGNNRTGKTGKDLEVRLPAGTVVRDAETGELICDLTEVGQTHVIARGGRGGRGNAEFATPTHQAPRRADPGEEGETRSLELELKLIADVGLVGLPSAGKSTFLSRISRARPKIGDYPFTTLEPGLGIVQLDEERQMVVADLPGLIEGAHVGRGLGLEFLRHVERTRVLAFLVDVTVESPAAERAMLEEELRLHGRGLEKKPRIMVLTKADLLPPEARASAAETAGMRDAVLISSHSGDGVKPLLESLWQTTQAALESEVNDE
jgi:GTP-binding protein